MVSRNSMLYWYPKIKNLDIPMPKTEIVETPNLKALDVADGYLETLNQYNICYII